MRDSHALLCVVLLVLAVVSISHQAAPQAKSFTKSYFTSPERLTWNRASKYCRERQSHLTFPDSQQDYDALQGMMVSNGFSQIHLGMHDLFWEGKFYTEKGELLTNKCFVKWTAGSPSGGDTTNCGGMTSEGMMDVACDTEQPFFCEENLTWSGYDLIKGLGYYKYFTDVERTWVEAVEHCRIEGAHLLMINSELEYQLLWDMYRFDVVWLGLQAIFDDLRFITLFDGDLKTTGYTRWAPGEPKANNIERPYGALQANGTGLTVRGPSDKLFVICEREQYASHKMRTT